MHKYTVKELNRITPEEFKQSQKIPLVVVLDNVRSLYNVGSVFRTSDAYRVQKIWLCGLTSTPPNAEIHKTALGAEFSVEWGSEADTLQVVRNLQKEGYVVFAVEQVEGSVSLESIELDSTKKYAVVMGHEVNGVQQSVVDACDYCLELPQYGTKHSLNVSVTTGIVIWEFFKQLQSNFR
ncbi:MAG: RNA methyltransferase [Paludibacteraceae bacterium]|nr:RNA methyltransferase [Paludibacteraceae bacterium]